MSASSPNSKSQPASHTLTCQTAQPPVAQASVLLYVLQLLHVQAQLGGQPQGGSIL